MNEAEELVAGLSVLQQEGLLCDVELEAENQTIPAHRAVLAAASPYFKAMFCGNFKEQKSQVVTIKEVTFVGLKAVVDAIYQTTIKLTTKNLADILCAAHLTQMTRIVDKCKEWMLQNMRKTNCLTLLAYAEKYNFQTIENAANNFVLRNFFDVCKTASFFEISHESLCRYFSSDSLRTDFKEEEVFKTAKRWIKQNKVTKEHDIYDIMKNIRFALIAPDVLSTEIMYDDIIQKIPDCHKLVVEAMKYHMNVYTQPLYTGNLNKPRGEPGILVIPNGLRGNGYDALGNGEDIQCLSLTELGKSKVISNMEVAIVWGSMSSIQKNNFLYLFGVVSSQYYQNFTKRYNTATNSWIDLKSIPRCPAVGASIASIGENIYVIGGLHVDSNTAYLVSGEHLVDDVYAYSIANNTWSISDPLPVKSIYSAASANRENIYVAGGYVRDDTINSLFVYDTKAKLWLTKKPMNHARCQHVLEVVNDKVYAIGGRNSITENTADRSIEMYNPRADQWTIILGNFPLCRHACASSFVYEQKIYFVGGTRNDIRVTKFDVSKKKIEKLVEFELPITCGQNVSGQMTLPKLL